MFRNILVSVSDKTGLKEFLQKVKPQRIVSTGGTAQYLIHNGFKVVDVSEQTGFPEVMGGRVKTLHPRVHMALLSRPGCQEDAELLKQEGLEAFDLLICNLYPFEQAVQSGVTGEALIEKIDIGGPSMLRAASKNFSRIAVLCDPKDYDWVSEKKELTLADRKKLAARVFAHTAAYDSLIAEKLSEEARTSEADSVSKMGNEFSDEYSFAGNRVLELRYGENPQQRAAWYQLKSAKNGLHQSKILQGKTLSYNNLLDLEAATRLVREFSEPCVVAVKHNNPCGVATDQNFNLALKKALASDPVSVFGGIIAANRKITASEAESLSSLFLECLVAPEYDDAALAIFAKKKNFRVLEWRELMSSEQQFEIRNIAGGFLIQEGDLTSRKNTNWKWVSGEGNAVISADLKFAEKVCASLKSNAIALVKNGQTMGLGMGQVNRVEAVGHAIERMKKYFGSPENVVMASDAFFPFADSIELAAQAGVRWILQPGGSVKDEEVIAAAKKLSVGMVFTGERHFRH